MTRNFFLFPKKKERKKGSNSFPVVENKDRGTQVGYMFRIQQVFADLSPFWVMEEGRLWTVIMV